MEAQNTETAIFLVAGILLLLTIPWLYAYGCKRYCERKVIIFHLMEDELIDAEYCMYLRLIYRNDELLWKGLKVPTGEREAKARLHQLLKHFHGDEHSRVSGALHVLMATLNVEKKHDVFTLKEETIRSHYDDFISRVKEEG